MPSSASAGTRARPLRSRRAGRAGRSCSSNPTASPAPEAGFADLPGGRLVVRVVGAIDRMELALAIADVAVSRAGAGHIAELTACRVPMILVPYPHATEDHQEANAREVEQAGAAEV